MNKGLKQKLMIALGWFFVLLGAIGAVLPLMPTTVFLIIALGIFSKCSPRFHQMLLDNKWFGPGLRQWDESRTISRSAKKKATVVIVFTFSISIAVLNNRIGLQIMLVVIAVVLLTIIWRLREAMKQVVILTMKGTDDFVIYDKLLDQPMLKSGWKTISIPWNEKNITWADYDAVIIRSTWDYQEYAGEFMQVLKDIEESGTPLLNSYKIARWNINKNYLREVEQKGAEIIPTLWRDQFDFSEVNGYFESFDTEQIIIKPTISANSDNTFWLKLESYQHMREQLESSLQNCQLMIQPFVPAVVEEGEYSLFYFAGDYSHCILKTPKKGDFRVQEEHGGILQRIEPCKDLLTAAEKALQTIPEKCLYARVDLVEFQGAYKIMEIELIEPSLYFNLDGDAAYRFTQSFNNWMSSVDQYS